MGRDSKEAKRKEEVKFPTEVVGLSYPGKG